MACVCIWYENIKICTTFLNERTFSSCIYILYTSCPDDSDCEHGTWGLVRFFFFVKIIIYCLNFPITYKKQLRKRNLVLPFLDLCLVTHSFFITEHPLVNEFTTCALTQMSQNVSFDLGSYRNHGRLNFHVSINLRVLGLLGVALTRVDAFLVVLD